MADLAAFSDAAFDPKQFINQAVAKAGDEPLERCLAELEMKLHLSAEDVSLYLQDHSARAMQRIPAAVKELLRIQEDVAALRASATAALAQLEEADAGGASGVVAQLRQLDIVKRRMEEACSTLKEAAGLSVLFQQVDEHFASGSLPRLADALAGMRRGLAVVGDSVAEFRGGHDRLARLEERFAAMVEGPLAAALAKQDGEEAASLAAMLGGVGRADALQRLYCSARLPPLLALWDGYAAGTPFAAWLPGFYEQVARALASEATWCAGALPPHSPALPMALLEALLARVDKPFRQRLGVAMAASAGSVMPLEHLEQAQAAATAFAADAFAALGGGSSSDGDGVGSLSPEAFAPVHARLLKPVEAALGQYGERELAYLSAELSRIASKGPSSQGGGADAAALQGTLDPAFAACEAALSRCLRLTSGTALPALARVLDRAVQQYVAALSTAVGTMRAQLAEAGGDADAEGAEAALPLLSVASQLSQRLAALQGSLRQAAVGAAGALLGGDRDGVAAREAGPVSAGLPTSAALRMSAQPALRQRLEAFAASAAGAAPLLPLAVAAAAELEALAGACTLEVLTRRPRAQLAALPRLPEWQQRAGALQLPTFSAYPLQYVTSVGEFLMMLPQQLEGALLGDEGGEEAAQLVSDWIDKVALETAAHYQRQLGALPALTPAGAAQLAADLEYFNNVLATLGVDVPPALAAWQASAAAPADGLSDLLRTAEEGGDAAVAEAVVAVARLRGMTPGSSGSL